LNGQDLLLAPTLLGRWKNLNIIPSSWPLGGGGSPAAFLGGWAPSLVISSPATEIGREPKERPAREVLAGWWSYVHEPSGVGSRETLLNKGVQVVSCLVDSK